MSTFEWSPATVKLGSGELAPNLEVCLLGMQVGEHQVFELSPECAFGIHNPKLLERIARKALPADIEGLQVNSLVGFKHDATDIHSANMQTSDFAGFVQELDDTHVLFDFNHPLAGKMVRFEVELIAIL